MSLPSGVSIGGARAQFHRARARKKAGWSRTVALWTFTKCPECRALIDATGDDWRDHERWHEELADLIRPVVEGQDDDPAAPVFEHFTTEEEDHGDQD